MRLNPKKCTFDIGANKFMGFYLMTSDIEVNPDKFEAIINMDGMIIKSSEE